MHRASAFMRALIALPLFCCVGARAEADQPAPPAAPGASAAPHSGGSGPSIFAPGLFTNDPATGRPTVQYEKPKAEQSVEAQHRQQSAAGTTDELLPLDPNVGPVWGWGGWNAPYVAPLMMPHPSLPHPSLPHPALPLAPAW